MATVGYKFNGKKFGNALYKRISEEQTKRLVKYAKDKIRQIGDTFLTANTTHSLDRTGNLLDSLCWGVSYNGKIVKSGFYRRQKASEESYLHEWFIGDVASLHPVYGHGLAQQYIDNYSNTHSAKGWQIFFAVLAPYWGYWEHGFRLNDKVRKLSIMTMHHDVIKTELKGADVDIHVGVPKYTQMSLHSLMKQTQKSPSKESRHFNQFPKFKRR